MSSKQLSKEIFKQLPLFCVDCDEYDGVKWCEYQIEQISSCYFDLISKTLFDKDKRFVVYCTRCDEELFKGEGYVYEQ